ncbi:S9 family peptidase [Sphingorhabdus contaminans]|uniref:S9 family peptidase n=1 Tax=Sphingorhabdus contaminans TaxID=1343899 RepID=UPI003D2C05DE
MTVRAFGLAFVLLWATTPLLAQVPSPDRPATDPKSVNAEKGPDRAIPDLLSLFDAKDASGASWMDDGRAIVASLNLSGRFNLWRVPLDGSAPQQLASSEQRQMAPRLAPGGGKILFQSDTSGGEFFDLFEVDAKGGTPANLTHTPDASEAGAVYSPDGTQLAFAYRKRGEASLNLATMDRATGSIKLLTAEKEKSFGWNAIAFSPDGKHIYAGRSNIERTDGSLWRISVADGTANPLGPTGSNILTIASDLSRDGRMMAIASNANAEEMQAGILDLASNKVQWLAASPWRQNSGHFSPDGRMLVYSINENGRSRALLYDIKGKRSRPLAIPPGQASIGSPDNIFTVDGRSMLIGHQASNLPFEYWAYDIRAKKAQRITQLAPANFDKAAMPASQIITYRGKDGTLISALMWLPFNLKRDGSAPAVAIAHGGPTAQTTDFYNRTALALVTRGYVVIAPNFRGSTGYGKAFQRANIKDLGGGDLDDMVMGARFLVETGYVDAKRIGIMGGSYGGYMTLMALGRTPDVWASGVNLYGILDWQRMATTTDPSLQAYLRSLLGDPVADKEYYVRSSPVTYLDQIRASVHIQQGENDIRVPLSEAKAATERLKALGKEVELVVYPQEGHGWAKRENQIDSLQRTVDWFDRTLKKP